MNRKIWMILSMIFIVGLSLGYICMDADAAPGKTRGRVNLDLENMVLRDSSTSASKSGLEADSDKTAYTLFYKNSFTDHNNIGIEYYYKNRLDLTDVTRIEWSGERVLACDCKAYLYLSNSTSTNKCRVDDKDMETSTFSAYGGDWFDVGKFGFKKYNTKGFDVSARYDSLYLHMGLVHDWGIHETKLKIGNTASNCVNLVLKEHKVSLLDVDKIKVVKQDGTTKQIKPLSNLRLRLNDGKDYAVGEAGKIYRDEEMVIQYTRSKDFDFDIVGYRFYSDKEKKNLLYTKEIACGENQTTIILDAALVQKLEEKLGTQKLGDIYVEPIVQQKEVAFDIVETVPGVSDVTVKKSSDGKSILITDDSLNQIVGRIELNEAAHIGDYFRMKYKADSSYSGNYVFSYVETRACDSKNNVASTKSIISLPNDDFIVPDYNEKLTHTYFWISVHVALEAELKLQDKTVSYNNSYVEIEPAAVSWPEGEPEPSNVDDIIYEYYTDSTCTIKMNGNDKPINAGTYYVKAKMAADSNYKSAISNTAKLVIEKAIPTIVSATAETITYGQMLGETGIADAKVQGVENNDITSYGVFKWEEDETAVLPAGTHNIKVKFEVTDSVWKKNYADVYGTAFVQVDIQNPKVNIEDAKIEYTGEPVVIKDTTVTDIYTGESTGQTIYYYYYGDVDGDGVIGEYEYLPGYTAPSEVGNYEVEAEVYTEGGNYGTNKDRAIIEIVERTSKLLILPMKDENEIRVIFTNTVDYEPKGKIQLSIGNTEFGEPKEPVKGERGYYHVSYDYDKVVGNAGNGEKIEITANYIPGSEPGYIAEDVTQIINTGTNYGATVKELFIAYAENVEQSLRDDFFAGNSVAVDTVNWYTTESDIIQYKQNGDTMTITGQNPGTTFLVGQAKINGAEQYIVYQVSVGKMHPQIILNDKEAVYCANTIKIDPAIVKAEDKDITSQVNVIYEYYSDASCNAKMEDLPKNAGTYYVKAIINESTEWTGTSDTAKIVIKKAEPEMILKDKICPMTIYPQSIDPAIVRGVSIYTEEDGYIYEAVKETISYSYMEKGSLNGVGSPDPPMVAGSYEVTAALEETANYLGQTATANLTIVFGLPGLQMSCVSSSYGIEPEEKDMVEVKNEDGIDIYEYVRECVSIRYRLTMGGDILTERPTDAGLYYAWAVFEPKNGSEKIISRMVEFEIKKSDILVEIPEVVEKIYDDEVINVDTAVVTAVNDGKDITDEVQITYQYYADKKGTIAIEAPAEVGEYYVRAVVEDMRNYNGGTSELQKVIISAPEEKLFEGKFTEDDSVNDNKHKTETAKTGDENGLVVYLLIAAVSLGVIIFIKKRQGGVPYEK